MSTISKFLPKPPDNFSTQIASSNISSSALSIELDLTSGLGTEGVGVLFKKDVDGEVVTGSIEFIHWTGVSGNTITLTDVNDRGITGSDSGAQAYVADDYFEVWVSSYYQPTTGILVEHNTDGTHDTDHVVTPTATQTLTNKRVTRRITSEASSATPTPNADTTDQYQLTALAVAAEFGAPTGTPTDGQFLIIRVKDNGTARALTWNAIYRDGDDVELPTTTVLGKTMYLGFVYHNTDSKWDLVAFVDNI